jgi:hypothetical protein
MFAPALKGVDRLRPLARYIYGQGSRFHIRQQYSKSRKWKQVKLLAKANEFLSSQTQIYITIDGQSASLTWCQAPIWDRQPIFLSLF